MKLVWKELNEKIAVSALASKETFAYILKTRRRTAWQRLARVNKSASVFFLLLSIGIISYGIFTNYGAILVIVQAVILLLVCCVLNVISYLKLTKMKLDEAVPILYKQVSSYKKLTIWSYLICYVLVFIFIVSILLLYPLPHFAKVLMFFIIPIGVAIDCFGLHWFSSHIHTLVDTSKELKELDKSE